MKSSHVRIALIFFLFVLFISNSTFAETKTIIKEYTYQASEVDSKVSSRAIAIEQAKRLLLEELGTYLESKTEVTNFHLTKDQITAWTAGIVKTEILTEDWNGKTYHLVAKIAADPDEVAKTVDALRKDQEKTKELEDVRKKADSALKEVEKLKKELEISKKDKTKIIQYNEAIQELKTTELVEKGIALSKSGQHSSAIKTFTKAIKNDPNYLWAYYHRGLTHNKIGNYKQSINDFNKAIKFDSLFSWAYYHRGFAYNKIGNKVQALNDLKKAAQLGDRFAQNYLITREIKWHENENVNVVNAQQSIVYIASKNSKAYHRPDCKWVMKIKPKNRILYKSIEEAEKNQKIPCSICNPNLIKAENE